MEMLVRDTGKGGFNLEQRDDMKQKYGHINVNVAERMNIVRGPDGKRVPIAQPGAAN